MVPKNKIGLGLVILGLILVGLSVAADLIGIGANPTFGWKQILGTIMGVISFLYGIKIFLGKTG